MFSPADDKKERNSPWPTSVRPEDPLDPRTWANDIQHGGDHYKKYGDLQPWDVVAAWNLDYFTGTALKYLARWKDKGGVEDLKKAIHFIQKKIELETK